MAKNNKEKKEEGAPAEQMSKRDAFRKRFSELNPDLNMDDEDAYYDAAGRSLDELDGYKQRADRLNKNIKRSPAFADMVIAARDNENFDPIIWAVEEGGLDLEALQTDPDYKNSLVEARAKYLEKLSKSDELKKEQKANMPASISAIKAKAEELGLDDAKREEIVGKMFTLMDDMIRGKIPVDLFEMIAKGATYDAAVDEARAEGKAEGLNQKVDDKLRKFGDSPGAPAGRQTPPPEPQPQEEDDNPFVYRRKG